LEVCLSPGGIVLTSLIACLEARVLPVRTQNQRLLNHYEFLFEHSGLRVLAITPHVVERATLLRASHGFRTPDAIHLATALVAGADAFLTGDKALARCPGLNVEIVTT
jgi:predicted nucleic acid-binding protein